MYSVLHLYNLTNTVSTWCILWLDVVFVISFDLHLQLTDLFQKTYLHFEKELFKMYFLLVRFVRLFKKYPYFR